MSRLPVVLLLLGLAGCSGGGGPVSSGPAGGTSAAPAVVGGTAPRGSASTGKPSPGTTAPGTGRTARDPQQLQALVADLRDPDDARRVRAARELRQWGKDAEPAA